MGVESKGRAWFGKIYNKLETILVEVDTFTSQSTLCLKSSDPSGWESIRSEPKEIAVDSSFSGNSNVQKLHDRVASPSCESPSDPPSHQNFDFAGSVRVEERVQEDSLKDDLSASSLPHGERLSTSPLLEKYCDANQISDTNLGDEEPIFTDEESQISTSPSLEDYSDASLSSATSLGDEETIITDEDSQISTSSLLEEYCDANLPSATNLGAEELIITSKESQISTSLLLEEYCDANLPSATSLGDEEPIITSEESQISTSEESQISTSSLLEDYCDANFPSATSLTDEKPIITDEESQITNTLTPQNFSAGNSSVSSGEESVEEVRVESCRDVVSIKSQPTQSSLEIFGTAVECNDDPVLAALATKTPDVPVQNNIANIRASNADDVINDKPDVASLYTNASSGMEFREGPSNIDDSALYALGDRTKKLSSFKRKLLDALTSKRRREKEYEQLAIWFGDADMASDLATKEDSKQVKAMDSKSSQVLGLENSHWELL